MGFIFHNQILKKILYQYTLKTENISLHLSSVVKKIKMSSRHQEIYLDKGFCIQADLLIAADGSQSQIREFFYFKTKTYSYGQTALTFLTRHDEAHQGRAFEHFLPIGPLAFLPLREINQSSVIWSLRTETAHHYLTLSSDDLAREVNQHFQNTLGDLKIISSVHSYHLACKIVPRSPINRLVLIGDAAHTIHPVAGQGFNLTLRDIQQLYFLMYQAQSLGLDITNQTLINTYHKKRRLDVLTMTGFTDGLVRLFSTDHKVINSVLSQGLKMVNAISPLKKVLVRRAMGISIF